MNAINKQNIARNETTSHVTSVAMPTRKIASARTHAARTCKAARIRTRKWSKCESKRHRNEMRSGKDHTAMPRRFKEY